MRVGLILLIAEVGLRRRATPYSRMRELARQAEGVGLDAVYVADDLFKHRRGSVRGYWEAIATLGALAQATTRVELGPLVLCTPFRNPGVIAWAANTLDEISGGRFVLGLGAGWHQPEFHAFGFEFRHRVSYLADALDVIVPLLKDGGMRPPGPRRSGPPILIAGPGPRMLGLTARYAERWNSVWYGLPADEFRDERRRLEEACLAPGRDPYEIEVSAGVVIKADSDVEELLAGWRDEGVAEVMCRLVPPSLQLVESIGKAVQSVG